MKTQYINQTDFQFNLHLLLKCRKYNLVHVENFKTIRLLETDFTLSRLLTRGGKNERVLLIGIMCA